MARSGSLSGILLLLGVAVFLFGVVILVVGLVRGQGVNSMALLAAAAGVIGVIIGRRRSQRADADTRPS